MDIADLIENTAWSNHLTCSGEAADILKGWLMDLLGADRKAQERAMEHLEDALLYPGVLCSAVPIVVPILLLLVEGAERKRQADLLSFIRVFNENTHEPNLESIAEHSSSVTRPYESFSALRYATVHAVEQGANLYFRLLTQKPRKRLSDLEAMAAILLSYMPTANVELLTLYRDAVFREKRSIYQAMVMEAARRIGKGKELWHRLLLELLREHRDDQSIAVSRFLAGCFLVTELGEEAPVDAWDALAGAGKESGSAHLPTLLEGVDRTTRFTIYKTLLTRARLEYESEVYEYTFELLRAAINEEVHVTGSGPNITDAGERIVNYHLRGPKAALPAILTSQQREALEVVLSDHRVWAKRANFWEYFGLPMSRDGIRKLLEREPLAGQSS